MIPLGRMQGLPLSLAMAFVLALAACLSASAQSYRVTHYYALPIALGQKTLPIAPPSETITAHGIVWNVYYEDMILATGIGFDAPSPDGDDRRDRLRDCVTYISDVLNVTGELDLLVGRSFKTPDFPPPGSFLAQGGTGFDCSADYTNGYAFHRLMTGTKALPGEEEVFIQFNFNYTWHAGAGPCPSGKLDIESVILHEIAHGIGLMGIADENGDSRLTGCASPLTGYTVWDGLLIRGSTGQQLFGGAPLGLIGSTFDLISGDVDFDGGAAFIGYDQGAAPPVYAPSTFRGGSSLAHFGTSQIVGGPIVMEHAISSGRTLRRFAPVEIGALRDIGYASAADPVNPGCDGMGGVADACGVCRGDGQSCLGCDGVPNSGLVQDDCGECGGEGLTCFQILGRGGFYETGDFLEFQTIGPTDRIQWLRNGQPLPGETGSTLRIDPVTQLDTGVYSVAYTTLGNAVVESNRLQVVVAQPGGLPLLSLAGSFTLCLLLVLFGTRTRFS